MVATGRYAPTMDPARSHPDGPAYVFHRGALGDSVLLWPLLRALVAAHGRVALVSDRSKSELAARFIPGVEAIDAEQTRFNAMFRMERDAVRESSPVAASRVLCLLFGEDGEAIRAWEGHARAMFPNAPIEFIFQRPDAALARQLAPGHLCGPLHTNSAGPIVVHVGAGSLAKRWPIERWASLEECVPSHAVRFIAGEAERGTFEEAGVGAPRWALFHERLGGTLLRDLDTLATRLLDARAFVGFDSGPTHLAAQLGVPTLALFGPTDPVRWGPIGPLARVLAPERPTPDMSWLSKGEVERAVISLVSE